MPELLATTLSALGEWEVAQALTQGRWSYATVSALHILGIALLVGGILPLDLRLLGFWRSVALQSLAAILTPMAVAGLLLAISTGVLLVSVRPLDYAGLPVLWAKLTLIGLGAAGALAFRLRVGRDPERASRRLRVLAALGSMTAWLGALACGRLIAFTGP
ncbi:hypothetical protein [Rhodovibrio salinarum]|uniref:DUF2214 domain-containing protein n=1 Tax=Rhodovibrio salinarum TaxID=1087 RepID=A0A934QHM0_9PROT|nr:hypothetical protein [Rhodovibrio salinarum]MBK1697193.1 hypothetical protein [Rhodovibrio salinarum]